MEETLQSAKLRHKRGEPLGFAVEKMLAEARARVARVVFLGCGWAEKAVPLSLSYGTWAAVT
jgi:hypothetical protein